jgi:hypothetical protein
VVNLEKVNAVLRRLAHDSTFQGAVRHQRLVRVALAVWCGKASQHSEADLAAAQDDDTVLLVYRRMKALEAACDAARIKIPLDDIMAAKTELSPAAVLHAFGPDVVAKHHLPNKRHVLKVTHVPDAATFSPFHASKTATWEVLRVAELKILQALYGMLKPNGQFVYSITLTPGVARVNKEPYNQLRHNGAVWALRTLYFEADVERAQAYSRSVATAHGYIPIFSKNKCYHAKLGAQALAYLADPSCTKFGQSLLDLYSEKDALFRHKVQLDADGDLGEETDLFRSEYYEGEAMLALSQMVRSGAGGPHVETLLENHMRRLALEGYGVKEQSHWMLHAISSEIHRVDAARNTARLPYHLMLVRLGERICAAILRPLPNSDLLRCVRPRPLEPGKPNYPTWSCPSAVRLEGMSAFALAVGPENQYVQMVLVPKFIRPIAAHLLQVRFASHGFCVSRFATYSIHPHVRAVCDGGRVRAWLHGRLQRCEDRPPAARRHGLVVGAACARPSPTELCGGGDQQQNTHRTEWT